MVTRLEPDHDHPNGGVLCVKGKAAPELVYHPDRLNHPLKRTRPKSNTDPGWQRVSWDQALDEITGRLISIRERFGARAVALAKDTRGGTSVSDAERWLARFLAFGKMTAGESTSRRVSGLKTSFQIPSRVFYRRSASRSAR